MSDKQRVVSIKIPEQSYFELKRIIESKNSNFTKFLCPVILQVISKYSQGNGYTQSIRNQNKNKCNDAGDK